VQYLVAIETDRSSEALATDNRTITRTPMRLTEITEDFRVMNILRDVKERERVPITTLDVIRVVELSPAHCQRPHGAPYAPQRPL
jgi:hypothetical protein